MLKEDTVKESKIHSTKKSLWNRSYIYLMLVSLITNMGFNMVYVIISKYVLRISDSLSIAGIIAGMFSISALVVRPLAGVTVDRVNKKQLCILANILIGISLVGYSLSRNVPMLFFFRVLHGASFGLGSTVNIALVTQYIPKVRMGEGLAYYGLGQVVAQVVSPSLGVYIEGRYGFSLLFLMIALLSFTGAGLLTRLDYTKDNKGLGPIEKGQRPRLSLNSLIAKEVIVYAMVGGIFSFSNGIVSSFLILLGEDRNIANVSLFFSLAAIVLFVLRLFVGRLVDKQGLSLIVNIALILTAGSMVLIGIAPSLLILLLASVLKSMGQGTGQIALQTESIKRVDPARVGVATSTFYIGADIGQGFGPMVGGRISDSFGYGTLFFVCACLILAAMLLFNIYQRKSSVSYANKI